MSIAPARRPASEVRTITCRRRGTDCIVHPNKALTLPESRGFQAISEEDEVSLSLFYSETELYEMQKFRSEEHETELKWICKNQTYKSFLNVLSNYVQ